MNKLVGIMANGKAVYMDVETEAHMEAHSDVNMSHISEAIATLSLEIPFFIDTVDLGKEIGIDTCVEVADRTQVQMIQRPNRAGLTPCIKGKGEPTTKITIGICLSEGNYYLFTAFYGIKAPKEPWDKNIKTAEEKAESEAFWSTHALAIGE